jgi:hypothetical protein
MRVSSSSSKVKANGTKFDLTAQLRSLAPGRTCIRASDSVTPKAPPLQNPTAPAAKLSSTPGMSSTARLSLLVLTSALYLVCTDFLTLNASEDPGIFDNGAYPQFFHKKESDLGYSCLPPLRRLATPCVGPSWSTGPKLSFHCYSSKSSLFSRNSRFQIFPRR